MTTFVDDKNAAAEESAKITAAELSEKDAPQNPSVARAYFQLLKPRVMTLVVFTAAVGLWLAPGQIEAWRAVLGLLILAIGAGASGAQRVYTGSALLPPVPLCPGPAKGYQQVARVYT